MIEGMEFGKSPVRADIKVNEDLFISVESLEGIAEKANSDRCVCGVARKVEKV